MRGGEDLRLGPGHVAPGHLGRWEAGEKKGAPQGGASKAEVPRAPGLQNDGVKPPIPARALSSHVPVIRCSSGVETEALAQKDRCLHLFPVLCAQPRASGPECTCGVPTDPAETRGRCPEVEQSMMGTTCAFWDGRMNEGTYHHPGGFWCLRCEFQGRPRQPGCKSGASREGGKAAIS